MGCVIAFLASSLALNQRGGDAHKREFGYGGVLWGDPECKVIGSSEEVHVVDALAITGDEGRASLRKAGGSWQWSFDPPISEWGNPPARVSHPEYIGMWRRTGRTETSKYPEEKKSTEIPQVVASERG